MAQAEVEEPGAGNLHRGKGGVPQVHVVHQRLGDGPGGHLHGLGPRHGKGGGIVPVLGVLGGSPPCPSRRPAGEGAGRGRPSHRPGRSPGSPAPLRIESYLPYRSILFFPFSPLTVLGPAGPAEVPSPDLEGVLPYGLAVHFQGVTDGEVSPSSPKSALARWVFTPNMRPPWAFLYREKCFCPS